MLHYKDPFVVGSRDTIVLLLQDEVDGVPTPLDLTGKTVAIHAEGVATGGLPKVWSATPDPDQINNPGRATYELGATDIEAAGAVELQAWVTAGGKPVKTLIVEAFAQRSIE